MTDPKEAFRSLAKEEKYTRIRDAIAQRLAEEPGLLVDVSQISQHDKDMVDIGCGIVSWVDENEERDFTGDPIAQIPTDPVAQLFLRKLGLLVPPTE